MIITWQKISKDGCRRLLTGPVWENYNVRSLSTEDGKRLK
jgi:hypothetical protein